MNINLRSYSVENLRSIADKIIVPISRGITLVTGDNLDSKDSKNGIGKSSLIPDAILFGFFGKLSENLKLKEIPYNMGKNTTKVDMEFDVGDKVYRIVRTLNPSKLFFYENGKDITQNMGATQESIENIIGCNYDIVKYSTILTLNSTTPFMMLTPKSREEFLSGMFDMSIFSDIRTDVKKQKNLKQRELAEITVKLDMIVDDISHMKAILDEEVKRKSKENSLIRNIEEKISKLDKKLNINLKEFNEQYSKLKSRLKESNETLYSTKERIKIQTSRIREFREKKECPTCNRPFSNNVGTNEAIIEANSNILLAKESIKPITQEIQTLESNIQKYHKAEIKMKEWYAERQALINEVAVRKSSMESNSITKQRLESLLKTEEELKIKFDTIKDEHDILEILVFVFGEDGVKSVIINRILELLNNRLNLYLTKFESPVSVSFDELFDCNITDKKKRERSYASLSGGEKRRVDLAIAFTFQDIRRFTSNSKFNFSVYDEIFDSSIDAKGCDVIMQILEERQDTENIFVISHRTELIDNYENAKIMSLIKQDGKTSLAY